MNVAARMVRAAAACILLLAIPDGAAWAWGARAHEIINRHAIDLLSDPARQAWSPLAEFIASHANDADYRKSTSRDESPRHFFDIDSFDTPPFDDVPRDRKALEDKGAKAAQRAGLVPWAIEECYQEVVAALRAGDWDEAGRWAADLGHYTADCHQPLHCTKNFDGQYTGNKGVHVRFEATMLNRFLEDSMLETRSTLPAMKEKPVEMCFTWIAQAYSGIDAILLADRQARALDSEFGDRYLEHLWKGTQDVAIRQIDASARDFAILLQAAWEEAGRPLPSAQSQPAIATTPPATKSPEPVSAPSAPPTKESSQKAVLPVVGIAVGVLLVAFFMGRD